MDHCLLGNCSVIVIKKKFLAIFLFQNGFILLYDLLPCDNTFFLEEYFFKNLYLFMTCFGLVYISTFHLIGRAVFIYVVSAVLFFFN